MRRTICHKILFAVFVSVAALIACSSHAPAIPPVQEALPRVEATPVLFKSAPTDSQPADYFTAKILPLVGKCQPCHFKGGKVYAKLPFDDPKTIHRLGEKLFSRIQDPKEQAVFRAFFAATADSSQ